MRVRVCMRVVGVYVYVYVHVGSLYTSDNILELSKRCFTINGGE